jgi:2-methylcitrate dehydratase PrpD
LIQFEGGVYISDTTNELTAIEALSANIVDTRFEAFSKQNIEDAKNRVIDIIGCAIGGANAPGNAALIEVVRDEGCKKESTIWVHGGKTTAQNAAMVNTIMARSFDFEVMAGFVEDRVFAAHHAASIIPTALALSESRKVSGRELLTAILLGDDTAARILVASAVGPIQIGWDGTMSLSHFGTTAVAGRLLGLNKKQMKHAFGIVLNMVAGAIQSLWDGATTFKFQGVADRNGIFAARLARKGWTGVLDPLLSRFGYYNVYAQGCKDPGVLTRDLGRKFWGETYYKPYPCGMPNHPAIDAALALVSKNDINTDDIKEVIIHVPPKALTNSYYAKPFILRDFPHGDAIFSYPYTVATALLKKSVGLPNFTEEAILDPKVNAITAKTRMVEQPGEARMGMGIKVEVKMNDGRELSESQGPSREWVKNPIPREKIIAKFWHQVDFSNTVSRGNAEKVLDRIDHLEEIDDSSDIVKLL